MGFCNVMFWCRFKILYGGRMPDLWRFQGVGVGPGMGVWGDLFPGLGCGHKLQGISGGWDFVWRVSEVWIFEGLTSSRGMGWLCLVRIWFSVYMCCVFWIGGWVCALDLMTLRVEVGCESGRVCEFC